MEQTVDLIFRTTTTGNAAAGVDRLTKSLQSAEKSANELREKMERVGQVGARIAVAGGAILAPLLAAANKYYQVTKAQRDELAKAVEERRRDVSALQQQIASGKQGLESELSAAQQRLNLSEEQYQKYLKQEQASTRLAALSERWEASQVRLGRVMAEIVVPLLEDALDKLEPIIAWAEKNPEAVKGIATVGASLVVLGGIATTMAQVVSTIATVQGLLGGAGLLGGGAAAAGGAATVAAGAGATAAGGGIVAALTAAAPIIATVLAGVLIGYLAVEFAKWLVALDWDKVRQFFENIALSAAATLDILLGFFGVKSTLYETMSEITNQQTNQLAATQVNTSNNQIAATNNGAALTAQTTANLQTPLQETATNTAASTSVLESILSWWRNLPWPGDGGGTGESAIRNGERVIMARGAESMTMQTANINLSNGMTVVQARRMIRANNAQLAGAIGGW